MIDRISTLKSAIRAIKAGNQPLFLKRYNQAVAGLVGEALVDEETAILVGECQARNQLHRQELALSDYVRFLLAIQQPDVALKALKCRPCGLEDAPQLNALKARIEAALDHCTDFTKYKNRYCIPHYFGTMDITDNTSRGRAAVKWAEENKHRKGLTLLSIGPNDGCLESRLLDILPESKIVLAELAVGSDDVIAGMAESYPGRVGRHEMKDFYDWAPKAATFDLIVLYEVLEHLPNDYAAVSACFNLLATGGTLLISVPNGFRYIEPERSDDPWCQHVRAYTAETLREALTRSNYFRTENVKIVATADKGLIASCSTSTTSTGDAPESLPSPTITASTSLSGKHSSK